MGVRPLEGWLYAGDAALRLVATYLRIGLRPYDSAGCWGGDEFVVL
ncbi:MAG: hypothetical protein ACPLRH_04580 [Desulfotomaculales bacterium]